MVRAVDPLLRSTPMESAQVRLCPGTVVLSKLGSRRLRLGEVHVQTRRSSAEVILSLHAGLHRGALVTDG